MSKSASRFQDVVKLANRIDGSCARTHFLSKSKRMKKAVEAVKDNGRLQIDVRITIIDVYEREHRLLPIGYVYMPRENSWFAEPCVSW